MKCPKCHSENPAGVRFCGACGHPLGEAGEPGNLSGPESERRHVTVLFTDLTGYTAMCERLDPEEVKEVMSRIFGEIAQVVTKYEGFIEKFIGDAAMALFGVPKAHEDDPVRAIKAAMEIHGLVEALSPHVEARGCKPLSMHSGINTGLVVTGGADTGKGTYGVTGDTINLASRLSGMGKAGEILVGPYTYRRVEGYFHFEALEPTPIEGKIETVRVYKVLSMKDQPSKIHRLTGLRAELIGRKSEMAELSEAVEKLREGKGSIIGICGDAGTGKSRLVEDFKASLDLESIRWHEGHAYAYSQNILYFPLIHLLSRSLRIGEDDPPETVRKKIEAGIRSITEKTEEIVPYIGGLFSLEYPDVVGLDPEAWKARLHKAVLTVLSTQGRQAPMVVCIEDLHWADPSSLELLRLILSDFDYPALYLYTHRPTLDLLPARQIRSLGDTFREIRLRELSPSETREMVESLLRDRDVSDALRRFILEKAEGNPFYIEEVINSLIESESLVRDEGGWRLTQAVSEIHIPATIQEVITARLDRLEKTSKLVLQEASVIGRTFIEPVLQQVTGAKVPIESCLETLEQLDLIRTSSRHPHLEYSFKHALIQEAAYSGLLLKQRREIHERIGTAMEFFFHDRLSEFVETLAFHFKQGRSVPKAVHYLVASGDKSLKRFALEESHLYYKEAFDLVSRKEGPSEEDKNLLVDLLIAWALVYYYRAQFKDLTDLLDAHKGMVETLQDKSRKGLFFAWLGFSYFWQGENLRGSYGYLQRSLALGEETGNERVIGYACAFLTITCAELGLLEECAAFIRRAKPIADHFPGEPLLALNYLAGMGYLGWFSGNKEIPLESARHLLEHGREMSNIRLQMVGYIIMGVHHFMNFDIRSAIQCVDNVGRISQDPFYADYARVLTGMFHISLRDYRTAETVLKQTIEFHDRTATKYLKMNAYTFLGAVLAATGRIGEGVKMIEYSRSEFRKSGRRVFYGMSEFILGDIYRQMVQRTEPTTLSVLLKNSGFLVKNYFLAARKAETHLVKAIEILKETGAKGFLGPAYYRLGLFYRFKGRTDEARACLSAAIDLFEQCEATVPLQEARDTLATL